MGDRAGADHEFVDFVTRHERRLRQAFTSLWGPRRGREVAVDALSFGWEHWDRVRSMDNPVGYLYVVGRERAVRQHAWHREQPVADFTVPSAEKASWYEPALAPLLGELSERERQVVLLVHAHHWTMSEVAEVLDVTKSTVQTHAERALGKLRAGLGVQP